MSKLMTAVKVMMFAAILGMGLMAAAPSADGAAGKGGVQAKKNNGGKKKQAKKNNGGKKKQAKKKQA